MLSWATRGWCFEDCVPPVSEIGYDWLKFFPKLEGATVNLKNLKLQPAEMIGGLFANDLVRAG